MNAKIPWLLIVFVLLSIQKIAAVAQESSWISVDLSNNDLVEIDVDNGAVSSIGPIGIDFGDFLDTAALGNSVYALDWDFTQFQVRLVELDIATGAATQLAVIEENGVPITFARGLATDGQQLFVAYSGSPASFESTRLGTLAMNGQVTLVANTGVDIYGLTNDGNGTIYGYTTYFDTLLNEQKTDLFTLNPYSLIGTVDDSPLFNGVEFQSENSFFAVGAFDLFRIDTTQSPAPLLNVVSFASNGDYRSLLNLVTENDPNCKTSPELQWEVGDTSPDFNSFRIGSLGGAERVSWYNELDLQTDYYVVSTCAMWCNPCQMFASDSQALVDELALMGIQIKTYDWIFQNVNGADPDAVDALNWIQGFWTTDPQNVWFGGDVSLESCNSVIANLFLSNDENAIPNILVLDNQFEIRAQMSGFSQGVLADLIVELDVLYGDVNLDGVVNLLDVQPFIDALSTAVYQIEADCNQDGVINLLDVDNFIAVLSD